MADLGKVIKGLKCCTATIKSCGPCPADCPYYEKCLVGISDIFFDVMNDALELLKAQESEHVSIKDSDGGETHWYVCGACKAPINPGDKYCHECGKAVKWNER